MKSVRSILNFLNHGNLTEKRRISCGLETEQIRKHFLKMPEKEPADTKALFVPAAAIDADRIEVML